MLFGKWCTTKLWERLRWPREVKIYNRDWKHYRAAPPQISLQDRDTHGIQETRFYPDSAQLVVNLKTEEETRKFVKDQPDIFGCRNYGMKYNYSYKTDKNDYRYIFESEY